MGSVAVLNPRDALNSLPKLDLDRTSRVRHGRRRRSPTKSPNTSPPPRPAKSLAMGDVKILRRGEELTGPAPKPPQPEPRRAAASALNRLPESDSVLGPAPAELPRLEVTTQKATAGSLPVLTGFFAMGGYITSPPPSSLPMPAFCAKKMGSPSFDDATSDLRKLLKLE